MLKNIVRSWARFYQGQTLQLKDKLLEVLTLANIYGLIHSLRVFDSNINGEMALQLLDILESTTMEETRQSSSKTP